MSEASTGQLIDVAGALAFLVRWLVLISSTILVLFVTWLVLSFLWGDEKAVSIRPFIIVDPSGKLKNAESGFAQILSVQSTQLEVQNFAARALLSSAASGQILKPQAEALTVPVQPLHIKLVRFVQSILGRSQEDKGDEHQLKLRPNLRPLSPLQAAQEKVELKVEGVDVPGVISWIKGQLTPSQTGLAFTAYISNDNHITITGDISDMKIDGMSTIYLSLKDARDPSSKDSTIAALDELAWRLFQLRMAGDDSHLRDLPPTEFRTFVDHLRQTADLLVRVTPQTGDLERYRNLSAYFAAVPAEHDDWLAMTILAAETARLGGDYETAVKYFRIALDHETRLSPSKQDNTRKKLVNESLVVATSAAAALLQTKASLTKQPELITRHILDDTGDASAVENLRRGFQALYDIKGEGGYIAIAGLHGIPGWYSWNHDRNSRSTANLNLFLPWVRAYLLNFERAARRKVPDFALLCWDWTKGGIPKSFTAPKLPDGSANPLAAAFIDLPQSKPPIRQFTVRHPGPAGALPSAQSIADVLSIDNWADFSAALENLSDQAHGWTGGDMGIVSTTSYDPLFYAHSCNVDRLWATWQKKNGISTIDPSLLDVVLDPFGIKVRDILDTKQLGYDYPSSRPGLL
jgi:hypothetical protein